MRNLNITPPPTRYRGRTITDDEVPYALKSPAKRLAQQESRGLQHSRSSTDLKSPGKDVFNSPKKTTTSYEKKGTTPVRPGQMRRRSTLHWTGASPLARQQKLEDVAAGRLADTWFSIHAEGSKEPIYVSEVMDKSMNPSFRFFDLNSLEPRLGRSCRLKTRLWAKIDSYDEYIVLIDIGLDLRSLQFIGKSLETFHHPLPENCVLFHLTDGIYTSFTDLPVEGHGQTHEYAGAAKLGPVENTSSYDALMRLANLDDCIQDALGTRAKIENQINTLLGRSQEAINTVGKKAEAQEKVASITGIVSREKGLMRQLSRRKENLRLSLKVRREAIESGRQAQSAHVTQLDEQRKRIQELRTSIGKSVETRNGHIRRISEELGVIYPIEPIKNKALHFSIRGMYLPNSAFDDTNRDEIAAVLGFTSHLTQLLSLYLSVSLPYPIALSASTSTIEDPISIAISQRVFPLYPTNASFKFEYAVLLLNKDIEFLLSKVNLRMLDIRHTLPNLKYLLYVLTAGQGEVPARRAGGIKGLMLGRQGLVTPSLSRRGSDDSVTSGIGWASLNGQLKNGNIATPGRALGQVTEGKEAARSPSTGHTQPHRGSGLKEAH